jgi:hypothetical protein
VPVSCVRDQRTNAGEVGSGSCDGSCLPMTGPGRPEETMRLTNSANLNSMDPVFIEFENWQFTVYRFKIFEKIKKYVKKLE